MATDNLTHPNLRGLLPADLIDIVAEADLHYDPPPEGQRLPPAGLPLGVRQVGYDLRGPQR